MCMPSSMEHQQIGTYIMNPYLNKYYVCATVVHSLIKVAVVRWHELVQSLAPLYLNTSSSSSTHVSRGRRMRANSQTLMPTHTLVAWRVTSRRILLHKKITPPHYPCVELSTNVVLHSICVCDNGHVINLYLTQRGNKISVAVLSTMVICVVMCV